MLGLGEHYARALITGASSGLGHAFSEALMKEGIAVWGTSRNSKSLNQNQLFTPVDLDLVKENCLKTWFELWDEKAGGFDLVINNAGFASLGSTSLIEAELIEEQLQVLLHGPIQIASAAVAAMGNRGKGCLVNVSSVAGEMWLPYMSIYNSAKAGLSAFSQSLMLESPSNPPWIIDFRPGDYHTAFNQNIIKTEGKNQLVEAMWQKMVVAMCKAPGASKAGEDLLSSLQKLSHCTRYSGTFVQTRIASVLSRLLPNSLKRKVLRQYYNLP